MSAVSQPQRLRSPSLPTWWQELRPGVVLAGLVVTFFILAVVAPSLLAGGQRPLAINLAETLRALPCSTYSAPTRRDSLRLETSSTAFS